ncbi:hypothetical protein EDF59_1752 [Novosphingobium sp. ST904]|nr:hypothetical protein EDF59_1752 [Novosphingobium sp. ST904]
MGKVIKMVTLGRYASILAFPDVVAGNWKLLLKELDGAGKPISCISLCFGNLHNKFVDCAIAPSFASFEVKIANPKYVDQSRQQAAAYSHQVVDVICIVGGAANVLIKCIDLLFLRLKLPFNAAYSCQNLIGA